YAARHRRTLSFVAAIRRYSRSHDARGERTVAFDSGVPHAGDLIFERRGPTALKKIEGRPLRISSFIVASKVPRASDGRIPSQADIAGIIAILDNPSLLNLTSGCAKARSCWAIASRVGVGNVNWRLFATWASKPVGRFIRLADFESQVPVALDDDFGT